MKQTLAALKAYTTDFYSQITYDKSNIVCSPVGSWLLLASIAANLDLDGNPELKTRIENCLHLPVENAESAVREILEAFPALNYVSHSWSAPNLATLPAIQKWIEANTLIPHDSAIPSQKEVDEWASSNTNGLIKEFPATMNDEVMLIIANIIYSKLVWSAKFHPTPAEKAMAGWNVENVLTTSVTSKIKFKMNEDGDIFVVYKVEAFGEHKESVRLVTCLTKDLEPAELMKASSNLRSMSSLKPSDERLLNVDNDMFKIQEVKRGATPYVIRVTVPAWEAESKHDLLGDNGLGYQEVVEAFNEGATSPLVAEAKQVAVAKFDKDGFEAAALTALVMVRSAMPVFVTQTVFELNFTKPFAFVSYTGNLPMFSGYIRNAKEGK